MGQGTSQRWDVKTMGRSKRNRDRIGRVFYQEMSMLGRSSFGSAVLAAMLAASVAQQAAALDTITRKSTDRRAAGEITSVSKTEVTVKPKVGKAKTVPANDIASIEWDGAPAALGLARAKEASGQYALAIADFETAQREIPATKANLRADVALGIARSTAKLALTDPDRLPAAVTLLKEFVEKHADHYRHFDTLLLLGNTLLAQNDFEGAAATFQRVAEAPWSDFQMAANVALGRTALARGNVADARSAFDQVVASEASNPAEQSRRFEAMLGQATCLQQEQQAAEAAKILGRVIMESDADDTRLQAEAYVRQGDAYAALGDHNKEAVMAYLHLDVIPSLSAQKDLHAESLYQLAQLWPQLGHPDRADIAAGKLQSQYPDSPWAKKLDGE